MPDDVIEEEATPEAHTAESSSDIALTTAEGVSDSVGTAAVSVEMRDNSQQDNT